LFSGWVSGHYLYHLTSLLVILPVTTYYPAAVYLRTVPVPYRYLPTLRRFSTAHSLPHHHHDRFYAAALVGWTWFSLRDPRHCCRLFLLPSGPFLPWLNCPGCCAGCYAPHNLCARFWVYYAALGSPLRGSDRVLPRVYAERLPPRHMLYAHIVCLYRFHIPAVRVTRLLATPCLRLHRVGWLIFGLHTGRTPHGLYRAGATGCYLRLRVHLPLRATTADPTDGSRCSACRFPCHVYRHAEHYAHHAVWLRLPPHACCYCTHLTGRFSACVTSVALRLVAVRRYAPLLPPRHTAVDLFLIR